MSKKEKFYEGITEKNWEADFKEAINFYVFEPQQLEIASLRSQ